MNWVPRSYSVSPSARGASATEVEVMELIDDAGNVVHYFTQDVNGTITQNGVKVYRALLNQTGTDAPVATVLENTIGAIVWTRQGLGDYRGTLAGAFPASKVFARVGSAEPPAQAWLAALRLSDDVVQIATHQQTVDFQGEEFIFDPADGFVLNTPVEILVYQ